MKRFAIYGVMLVFGAMTAGGAEVVPLPEKTPEKRIAEREFPSIFQAWNPADNLKGEAPLATIARHDLVFRGPEFFKLQWDGEYPGLATAFKLVSIQQGKNLRNSLLKMNSNLVLILEIRYRDAWRGFLPEGHKWWKRDAEGKLVMGWVEGGFIQMDLSKSEYREQVARQCEVAVKSGVVDGVMLDWWKDDDDRLALITAIRKQIGEKALIIVNANDRQIPRTAPYVNGLFMECYRSQTAEDWKRIADTLVWAEKNLRSPRINCMETWYHKTRADMHLMRATTTLSLVVSDGYCLFSDPNPLPTPDHLHDWYPFWARELGKALERGVTRPDGAISREFTKGTAVYNPRGNETITLGFNELRTSRATGKRAPVHTLDPCDGDLFLKDDAAQQTPAGDVATRAAPEK